MALRVSELAGEYAAVAAWTGQTEDEVRTGAGFHGGAHLVAWDGDRIVGLAHRWHDRHGRQRLIFRRCDAGRTGRSSGRCGVAARRASRPMPARP
jgi:hypothetical protein